MLRYKERKVSILRLELWIIIAVSVNSNDTVRILSNYITIRIHAERSHLIFELLRAVNDLTLIEL